MKINDLYFWEVELSTGEVFRQWGDDGKKESSWRDVTKPELIVRASLIPKVATLPRHDVLIDISHGERFIKRFGRGFIQQGVDGYKLRQYLNCIRTNRYALWVFPDGRTMITRHDFEVKL